MSARACSCDGHLQDVFGGPPMEAYGGCVMRITSSGNEGEEIFSSIIIGGRQSLITSSRGEVYDNSGI